MWIYYFLIQMFKFKNWKTRVHFGMYAQVVFCIKCIVWAYQLFVSLATVLEYLLNISWDQRIFCQVKFSQISETTEPSH